MTSSKTRETERTLLDRLNSRYDIKVKHGSWCGSKFLRAEQVPVGLSRRRHRICDFIATSMHATPYVPNERTAPPPVYHGHEVKTSRSDWLTELRDPSKAEAFKPFMHYWWLVAPREVVREDLPEGWGWLVPYGKTLRVEVPASLNPSPTPMPEYMHGALLRATVTTESRILTA